MGVSQNREALRTLGLYTDYKGIAGVLLGILYGLFR